MCLLKIMLFYQISYHCGTSDSSTQEGRFFSRDKIHVKRTVPDSLSYGDVYESEPPFSMERFETTLDGTTLKLDFEILALPLFFTWEMRVCLTKSAAGSWTSAVSSPLPPSWMEILLLQLNRKGSRGRHLRYPGGADTSICRLRIHRPRVLFPGVPL